MEQFEKRLFNLKVPKLENDPLKHSLRRDLINAFLNTTSKYKLKYKIAVGFSALMVILFIAIMVKPQIALKINQFAFNKNEKPAPVNPSVPDDNLLRYTATEYPSISTKSILPESNGNRTYIIRRYSTGKNGKIMVVSEIKKSPRKSNVKIVY